MSRPSPAPAAALPNSDAQRERIRELLDHGPHGRLRQCLTAAIELDGRAEEGRLATKLAGLAVRRPALASVFTAGDTHRPGASEPAILRRQFIDAPTAGKRWELVHEIARQEARCPFTPGESPLVRGMLLSAQDDRHLLVVSTDQLVSDAWSANLLVDDLLSDEGDRPPDEYGPVWRAREAWLHGADGAAAVSRRQDAVAGAWRRWPVPASPERAAPGEIVELLVDLDDDVTLALRDRVRRSRGSLLAAGAAAIALSAVPDLSVPLALTSTLAGRETPAEGNVVGWLANDAVIVLPARAGNVHEYLTVVRDEIFAALRDQRVPYGRIRHGLRDAPAGAGLSFALLFLPGQLSGGQQSGRRLGAAVASRAAVSICPTGADVDLFMVERPPPRADGARPLLRLGATGERRLAGAVGVERILDRWAAAISLLARRDWAQTLVAELAAALRDHAQNLAVRG